jgi:hypothetical protein
MKLMGKMDANYVATRLNPVRGGLFIVVEALGSAFVFQRRGAAR